MDILKSSFILVYTLIEQNFFFCVREMQTSS